MDRTSWLSPLGHQRIRLLECLGGNDPRVPGYLETAADTDVLSVFRRYVARLSAQWAAETDPHAISLLAAGRLLTGDLSAASVILDHLPIAAVKLDHGAGICLVAPLHALRTALPLPQELADTSRWLAGSSQQTALRAWLAEHRNDLHWSDTEGTYRLAEGSAR